MGQWDIVELANFWKIAGKGYGGKVERRDGSLGHRLVTKSKVIYMEISSIVKKKSMFTMVFHLVIFHLFELQNLP